VIRHALYKSITKVSVMRAATMLNATMETAHVNAQMKFYRIMIALTHVLNWTTTDLKVEIVEVVVTSALSLC